MMRFPKYILYVVSLIVYFSSCQDEKQQWLNKYAEIKCAYISDTINKANDKSVIIKESIKEKEAAEKNLSKVNAVYKSEIKLLEEKIIKENSEYLKKYRTESDKQSDLYGHFSTPAYEKKMYALKLSLAKNIEAYNGQIEQIKMQRDADSKYKQCHDQVQKITNSILEEEKKIDTKYKTSIDSLQKLLNEQNSKFNDIAANLKGSELLDFKLKRDKLKENPCIK
ncbi:MAG: hypothetical protein PHP53_22090 [Prolixibacteraceae bacterium]|jgi:hypothetical protein|nr:hypothetical protein [Prolixibacteraceae bacterium]